MQRRYAVGAALEQIQLVGKFMHHHVMAARVAARAQDVLRLLADWDFFAVLPALTPVALVFNSATGFNGAAAGFFFPFGVMGAGLPKASKRMLVAT